MIGRSAVDIKSMFRYWRMSRDKSLVTGTDTVKITDYRRWRSSLTPGRTALRDAEPWITFGARDHLQACLNKESRVFEWGSGGSTLFLLKHAGEVVTIEHDAAWFQRVTELLQANDQINWTPVLIEPESDTTVVVDANSVGDWTKYTTGDVNYQKHRFTNYVKVIDQYPDHYFDVVIVDGRSRPACIVHGFKKLKPGGTLILDNSEVKYYDASIQFLKDNGCIEHKFSGPGPYNRHFWRTTAFLRPARECSLRGAA